MARNRDNLREDLWYSAYHVITNRMLNVRLVGSTDDGMLFEDREKRQYSNREFYFWKRTE